MEKTAIQQIQLDVEKLKQAGVTYEQFGAILERLDKAEVGLQKGMALANAIQLKISEANLPTGKISFSYILLNWRKIAELIITIVQLIVDFKKA